MEIQLRELIDQIKNEGVDAAEAEAKAIVDKAKTEADKIIADARAEADKMIADAKAENDRKKKYQLMRIESTLQKEITRIKYNLRY